MKIASAGSSSVDMAYAYGPKAAEFIKVPGAFYMRGNEAFLNPQAPQRAAKLAGRWIRLPESAAGGLGTILTQYSPAGLNHCLRDTLGTLHVAGTSTQDGERTILIRDAGNAPGSTPTEFTVAATGPPYLLEVRTTGRRRPGGPTDVCHSAKSSTLPGTTITLSDYGQVPPIKVPSDVLTLPGS